MRPIPWWFLARLAISCGAIASFNAETSLRGWQLWAAGFAVGFATLASVEYMGRAYRSEQAAIRRRRAARDSTHGRPLPPYLRERR